MATGRTGSGTVLQPGTGVRYTRPSTPPGPVTTGYGVGWVVGCLLGSPVEKRFLCGLRDHPFPETFLDLGPEFEVEIDPVDVRRFGTGRVWGPFGRTTTV